MSKDFHHGLKRHSQRTYRKRTDPDWEYSKIPKTRSKQRREDTLRHAVRHGDFEALDDYEEPDYE